MEVKKVIEEWNIWNKGKEVAKLEKEAKKLVPEKFYKQIHMFEKKTSKRILVRKMWDHTIEIKKEFVLRKENCQERREKKCVSLFKNN